MALCVFKCCLGGCLQGGLLNVVVGCSPTVAATVPLCVHACFDKVQPVRLTGLFACRQALEIIAKQSLNIFKGGLAPLLLLRYFQVIDMFETKKCNLVVPAGNLSATWL